MLILFLSPKNRREAATCCEAASATAACGRRRGVAELGLGFGVWGLFFGVCARSRGSRDARFARDACGVVVRKLIIVVNMLKSYSLTNDSSNQTAYYDQIMDPFKAPLCRIPGSFVQGTQLVRDRQTFQITTGTGANDFVAYFAPENSIRTNVSSTPTPNDYAFIARSSTLASYNTMTYGSHLSNATATEYASRNSAWQQTYATYWQAVRLVSAGLRIRYIGRQDAEAGLLSVGMTSVRAPHSSTVLLDATISEFPFNYRGKTADGLVCNWIPTDFSDQSFINVSTADSQSVSAQNVFFIHGFGIPDGTVLDVEVVRNYEYYPRYQYQELLNPLSLDVPVQSISVPALESKIASTSSLVVSSASSKPITFSKHQGFFGKVTFDDL